MIQQWLNPPLRLGLILASLGREYRSTFKAIRMGGGLARWTHHRERTEPMQTVGIREAQRRMEELIERALAGEEIIIRQNRTPVARLVTLSAEEKAARAAKEFP